MSANVEISLPLALSSTADVTQQVSWTLQKIKRALQKADFCSAFRVEAG